MAARSSAQAVTSSLTACCAPRATRRAAHLRGPQMTSSAHPEREPEQPETLAAILHLTEQGFHVFPLARHTKKPVFDKWQERATNDADQVRSWTKDYPGCNWALATGRASGVFVLDIDGAEGEQSYEGLVIKHGNDWIQTRRAKT